MRLVTFIFLCFVWGTTWVAIKISLEGLPPFLGAAARFSIALILLSIYIKWKSISLKMKKQDFWIVSISAFLMYALDYGLIYWGEQYLSAGVTAIFFATFPLFTGIFATFLFRNESFQWTKFFGLLLGLIGVAIVFFDQLFITQFQQKVIGGILAIIIGAACGAMSVVLVKKFLSHVKPVSLSFHQLLQGVLFLLLFGLVFEHSQNIKLSLRVGFAVVYLGAMGSALAFVLYYWLLQQFAATTLSLIIYITPIIALFVDYLVFGEIIQLRAILGMMTIFAGIALVKFDLTKVIRIHNKILKNFK